MLLIVSLLLVLFAFVCIEYKWIGALYFTLAVGFLQDPIRKSIDIDTTYISGLVLIFFLLTFVILRLKHNRWYLDAIFWFNPKLIDLLSIFVYLLTFQALNSYFRFNDVRLTIVGVSFYVIPLLGLWIGFIVGTNYSILRRLLIVYFIGTCICGLTVYLDFRGMENQLFGEVGVGLDITGFGQGSSGVWRTSEIAAWHLASGACIGFILGITEKKSLQQILYFSMSLGLALLTTTTGRRKALGIVLVFASLYLLSYTFVTQEKNLFRTISTLGLVSILLVGSLGMFLPNESLTGENVDTERITDRTASITTDSVKERFEVQGLKAFLRGVEIAGPIGLGVGAGTNSGNTGIGRDREGIRSLGFVSEGGAGRIIVELGTIGGAIIGYLILNIGILIYKNVIAGSRYMDTERFFLFMGLLVFTLVNIAAFFAAGQLYSDIFVLIIIGLCFGAFTALPVSISTYRKSP